MAVILPRRIFPPQGMEQVPDVSGPPVYGPQGGIVPAPSVSGKNRIYDSVLITLTANGPNAINSMIPLETTLQADQGIEILSWTGRLAFISTPGAGTFTLQGLFFFLANNSNDMLIAAGQYSSPMLTIVGLGAGVENWSGFEIIPFLPIITYRDLERFAIFQGVPFSQPFKFYSYISGMPTVNGSIRGTIFIMYRIVSGLKEG